MQPKINKLNQSINLKKTKQNTLWPQQPYMPSLRRGVGTSLAVQWLTLSAFTAVGLGSIPGRGTKIPQVVMCGQTKKKKKKGWVGLFWGILRISRHNPNKPGRQIQVVCHGPGQASLCRHGLSNLDTSQGWVTISTSGCLRLGSPWVIFLPPYGPNNHSVPQFPLWK